MIANVCLLYGWKREYILEKLTWSQLKLFYEIGHRADYERRGWKFNEVVTEEQKKELRDLYYTEEEKAEIERFKNNRKALKEQFGDDIEGL